MPAELDEIVQRVCGRKKGDGMESPETHGENPTKKQGGEERSCVEQLIHEEDNDNGREDAENIYPEKLSGTAVVSMNQRAEKGVDKDDDSSIMDSKEGSATRQRELVGAPTDACREEADGSAPYC